MKTIIILLATVLALTGCASDMTHYYQTVQAANNSAEALATARITALQNIGQTGGEGAKVAAAIMLGSAQAVAQVHPAPPKSFADGLKEWAQILTPGAVQLGQAYMANKTAQHQVDRSAEISINQSNNATAATVSTNSTFGALAGAGFNAVTSTASAGFNAAGSIAGQIQQPAPNITISGNGVIGAGSYATENVGGNGATGASNYTSNPITGSYNPVDNSQRNPIDNSNQGNPVDNSQHNPIDNSNQNNPVGH